MRTEVCAKLRFVGFHSWALAPAEVGYLMYPHRHEFVVRAWASVTHSNRDIEFHMLARELRQKLGGLAPQNAFGEYELGDSSCEHIAEFLMQGHAALTRVEVWEDDEMGAVVYADEGVAATD